MPKFHLTKTQVIIIMGALVLVIIVGALGLFNLRPTTNNNPATKATLTVWGTESPDVIGALAAAYPYAAVSYQQFPAASYDNSILSALAAGNGPDVFEIQNREVPKFKFLLAPLPTSTQAFTSLQLSQLFPDVVAQDFVENGQLYGLPLYLDTLVMVYNKDLFNTAGIVAAPATWDQFDADVAKIRAVNSSGAITRSGAAIGGSLASIPNAPDILALLMLQNGTQMTDSANAFANFASQTNGAPGIAAFNFYLQFANPTSPYYTWNDSLGNAFDQFAAGKVGIAFVYQSDLAAIKTKAPFLHIGIAPVPQPTGANISVSYPRYGGFVAARAGQQAAAWNFILYFAALSTDAQAFVNATGKPPALRAAIQADLNDPNLSVFAAQALTAQSWYEADAAKVDAIMSQAIQNVLVGNEDSTRALNEAANEVDQLM